MYDYSSFKQVCQLTYIAQSFKSKPIFSILGVLHMASIPEFTDKEKCSFMEMDKISLDQNPSSKFLEADKNPELKFSTLYKYLVHKVQSCDCNQNKDFFFLQKSHFKIFKSYSFKEDTLSAFKNWEEQKMTTEVHSLRNKSPPLL